MYVRTKYLIFSLHGFLTTAIRWSSYMSDESNQCFPPKVEATKTMIVDNIVTKSNVLGFWDVQSPIQSLLLFTV